MVVPNVGSRCHRRPGNPLRQAGIAVVTLTERLPHDGSVARAQRNGANRGSAGKSRYRPSREPRARCDFKANAGSGEAVNIWNQIQAVMSGRRIIVSTRRLPLLELELGSQRAEAFRNCTMLAPAWTAFRVRQEPAGRLNQRACPDARLEAIVSADRIVSWAAAENARERMRTVATRPVMPEAARIIATMMNW